MTICSWLNFGRPMPPGNGSVSEWKFLAPPYYSQRTVFASPPSVFFINLVQLSTVVKIGKSCCTKFIAAFLWTIMCNKICDSVCRMFIIFTWQCILTVDNKSLLSFLSSASCGLLWAPIGETAMGNRQPKLSKEDLNALLDKTCFTKSQIKTWYKGFMVTMTLQY